MLEAKFWITIQNPRGDGPISRPHLFAHRRSLLGSDILWRAIHSASFDDETIVLQSWDWYLELAERLKINKSVNLLLWDKFSWEKKGEEFPVTLEKKISLRISDLLPEVRCICIENASNLGVQNDGLNSHLLRTWMGIQICKCGWNSLVFSQRLSDEAIDNVIARKR